jgi:hypothetical protein
VLHLICLFAHVSWRRIQVWCGVATSKGHFFVSGSHDRSIRMWERTDEQLVLSEEREAEREAEFENMAADDNEREQVALLFKKGHSGLGYCRLGSYYLVCVGFSLFFFFFGRSCCWDV